MTTPKKLRFWLVILILIGLGIGLRPDPALTEPPKAVATTLAAPLTGDHWRIDTFAVVRLETTVRRCRRA